jgi:RimJ/RimL family protein N-acetyltransferase
MGYVQLTVTSDKAAWLGYVFSKKNWGRGHATRAVQAVLDEAVSTYGVLRYLATVEASNLRSIRLLERLGFHRATESEREGHELAPTECLFVRMS